MCGVSGLVGALPFPLVFGMVGPWLALAARCGRGRRVGSSSWHGRLLDVSSAWGMPRLQQSDLSGTMSCNLRTPGLREGDCPSEFSGESREADAPL